MGHPVDFNRSVVHDTRKSKPQPRRNIMSDMTNLEKLKQANLIDDDSKLNQSDKEAIETLSDTEVESLISSKDKLGEDFIRKHVPHGMMF
jgi:hypothetical protein